MKTWTIEQIERKETRRTVRRMEFVPVAERDETGAEWRCVDAVVTDVYFTADGITVERCNTCGLFHIIGRRCPICR